MAKSLLNIEEFSIKSDAKLLDNLNLILAMGHHRGLIEQCAGNGAFLLWDYFFNTERNHSYRGTITIDDVEISALPYKELKQFIAENISFITPYHDTLFLPNKTIGKQMQMFLKGKNLSPADIETAIEKTFKQLQIKNTNQVTEAYPHQLTKTALYKIFIALNYIWQPKLILLFQPLQNLLPYEQSEIVQFLQLIAYKDMALMLFDNRPDCAGKICNQISFFHNGVMKEAGNTEKMLGIPNHDYSKAMVKASFYCKKPNNYIQSLPEHMMPNPVSSNSTALVKVD